MLVVELLIAFLATSAYTDHELRRNPMLPTLAFADIRFGDQVAWQSMDGPYTGLVIGFTTEIGPETGCLLPFMQVKCPEFPNPVKVSMAPAYLALLQLEVIGVGR
jgi:hypothetical protein